jgi:hypothetical protein
VNSWTKGRVCREEKLEDGVEIVLRFAGDFIGTTVLRLDRSAHRGV